MQISAQTTEKTTKSGKSTRKLAKLAKTRKNLSCQLRSACSVENLQFRSKTTHRDARRTEKRQLEYAFFRLTNGAAHRNRTTPPQLLRHSAAPHRCFRTPQLM
ncbi:hypothetical protein L596_025835 [Steinernema carpocapsae]|uniref:Uncharacterized protein n=1 Tax=Steinernema carpocapsae TaxID=34508 RepID=A0A4U5M8Z0_STECR|nr:hypothetical protein L596_025835 [Steinernema carpocapsae]